MTFSATAPTLSILIPAYNEQATIAETLERVRQTPHSKEIIVVDDCSTDGTREWLQTHAGTDVRLLCHERNLGKGAALRTAMAAAVGDMLLIQDADLEYDPNDYDRLIDPIVRGAADVVFGSRFTGHGAHRVLYFWHYVGNRFLTLMSNVFTNINLTDMECGYKVFSRQAAGGLTIEQNRFGVEPELVAKVARKGLRIYEVPISYYGRTYAEGKKIGWRDGVKAIWCILKYNLVG